MWDSSVLGGPGPLPTLVLTTTGRKSGEPRPAPLIYGEAGDSYVIIASKGGLPTHPIWYLNLEANPNCELMVGSKAVTARAPGRRGRGAGAPLEADGQALSALPRVPEERRRAHHPGGGARSGGLRPRAVTPLRRQEFSRRTGGSGEIHQGRQPLDGFPHEEILIERELDGVCRTDLHAAATTPTGIADHGQFIVHAYGIDEAHPLHTEAAAHAVFRHRDAHGRHLGDLATDGRIDHPGASSKGSSKGSNCRW